MDQFRQVTVITRTGPDGVLEGIQRQIGAQRAGHSPADDAAGEQIHHEGDIDEPGPRRDVRDVGNPPLVRGPSREVTLEPVAWLVTARRCGTRRAGRPGVGHPSKAQCAHPTLHGAPGHGVERVDPVDDLPHLPGPVHAHVLLVQRDQTLIDDRLTHRSGRGRSCLAGVVRTRGDLDPGLGQGGADRLDPVFIAVLLDERVDVRQRRSSSACAKYALA